MVLAIGLLVDDAIVVVENVERLIQTKGFRPVEAARKSMDEISGALIAIATVLAAVFLPMAFFGGSTGVIYRQFSLTIVSAMALSVLVALIFTPALAATILKPDDPLKHEGNGPFARFFRWFNDRFERGRVIHEDGVRKIIGGTRRSALAYVAIVVVMAFAVLAPANRLHARRGHRRGLYTGRRAVWRHPAAHRRARSTMPVNISRPRKARMSRAYSRSAASHSPARARMPAIAFLPLKPWERSLGQTEYLQGDRRPRHGRAVELPRCANHFLHSSGSARAGQRDRLRPAIGRYRQYRPCQADRGA